MSENLKLRLDSQSSETQQDRLARAPDAASAFGSLPQPPPSAEGGPNDEAESQMRKALGLLGDQPRYRQEPDRAEQPARIGDRFSGGFGGGNGGLHRRRFVQDGDIPVTVLRRDQPHEAPAHRGIAAPAAPTTSRLQRTEAALAAETAAHDKVERLLAEAQSAVRDLQTRIGHADLAKSEAIEALGREREGTGQLRAENVEWEERLQEAREQVRGAERSTQLYQEQLAEERLARKAAEKAQRVAEAAKDSAEQLVRTLSDETPPLHQTVVRAEPVYRSYVPAETEPAASRRGRASDADAAEPEPVKWWLNTKPAGKKR